MHLSFELSAMTARIFLLFCAFLLLFCLSSSRPAGAIRTAPTVEIPPVQLQHSAISEALAIREQSRLDALRAVERISDADSASPMGYPRNLHRIYDGTWKAQSESILPFSQVPPLPMPRAVDASPLEMRSSSVQEATSRALTNYTNATHPESVEKYRFTENKGFVLLTAQNHETTLSALHIVLGELLFRDGKYRTPRDVAFRMAGVYEWKAGVIYGVADPSTKGVDAVLGNLYDTLAKHRTQKELDNMVDGNLTKEKFVSELHRPLDRLHKTTQIVRPTSIPSHCPFEAVFNVKQDIYMDKAPGPLDVGSPVGVQTQLGIDSSVGTNLRITQVLQDGEDISVRGAQSRFGREQVTGQEEMVKMSAKFTSTKCHAQMSMELKTLDTEMLFVKAINYTLLVTVVAFTQVIVLIRQMEMTSTQAGASRVSLMTVGLQAVADSYLCLGHLTLGIAVHTLFNAFATAAFFKFICFSIFLMRWMLLIWKARRPSGFSEGWEAMRRELSVLYSRFYISLIIGLFLLYQLQDHIRIFIFGLYSFWLPQIILNVVEDHRRPLLPMYIIGTSVTRLAIPLYFWGCPKNFLHIHPLPKTVLALVGWIGLQALILLSQYKLGPRWFIPKAFLPEKYDYYRPVEVEDDEEEDVEAQNKDAVEGDALVAKEARRECCICMECVLVHSRDRMVTPCGHYFHEACLLRWLEVRLECALCRRAVPPP